MTNYAKGANLERMLKKHLEELGYFVMRSAGSHGPIDLVALRTSEIRAFQVKKGNVSLSSKQYNDLKAFSMKTGVMPEVARYLKGRWEGIG